MVEVKRLLQILKDRSRRLNYIKRDYEKLQLTGKWKRKWMLFLFFCQINKSLTKRMEVAQRRTVVQPSSSVSFLMRRGFSLSRRQPFSPSASGSPSLGRSLSRSSLLSSPPRRQEPPKLEQIGLPCVKELLHRLFKVYLGSIQGLL